MGICGKEFDNFINKSHNLQMLCCELNANFQNAVLLAQARSPQTKIFWRRFCRNNVRKWD